VALTNNPGILGDEELISSFVVRQASLDLILEVLVANSTSLSSNRHVLVVGPRGIGKTMLVKRVVAEVRRDSTLKAGWFSIPFGEESYKAGTAGEFWLEALSHLADETGQRRWKDAHAEINLERNEQRLREAALGQLLDFADGAGRRLLLVVENLQMLLGEMNRDSAWDLRHTLLSEKRLMLLGTATSRFEGIANADQAWFEMMSIHRIEPLDKSESRVLWHSVSGDLLADGPASAIRILTGGNPRLLKILASFASRHSFRELMDQLVQLIDDHTEYFKSQLDALAPQERRVFVALLEQWDPISATTLASSARLPVNVVSTLLGRLQERGAVEVAQQKGRRRLYQVSERLYNIYYLMRRRGTPTGRVHALVSFMVTLYRGKSLAAKLGEIAQEACTLPEGTCGDHYLLYEQVLRRLPSSRPAILRRTPLEFFRRRDLPVSIRLERAYEAERGGRFQEAEGAYREAIRNADTGTDLSRAWYGLGEALWRQDKDAESALAFREAANLDPGHADAWAQLGFSAGIEDPHESESAWRHVVDLEPGNTSAWVSLAEALAELGRTTEATEACSRAISLGPTEAGDWTVLAGVLADIGNDEEAIKACEKGLKLEPGGASALWTLGRSLGNLGRFEEAEAAFRKSVELEPSHSAHWNALGMVLVKLGRRQEAAEKFRKAVELSPEEPVVWSNLGHALLEVGSLHEAEAVWTEALQKHESLSSCAVHLIEIHHSHGAEEKELLREAREWVERSPRLEVLRCMARTLVRFNLRAGLDDAESWARRAVALESGWPQAEVLGWVLAWKGNWDLALREFTPVLEAASSDEDARATAIDFLLKAGAAGHAKSALDIISASEAATALEPLIVGLRLSLGESPVVAKEILEVGGDVAEQIRQLRTGPEVLLTVPTSN